MARHLFLAVFLSLLQGAGLIAVAGATEQVVREAGHIAFTEAEKKIIREFFGDGDQSDEAPGPQASNKGGRKKNKPSGMPPGLRRQLERNGTLPPGLQKKPLPPGLQSRLPDPPRGYDRVIVDSDVLLVETATGIIRDIIRDVLR